MQDENHQSLEKVLEEHTSKVYELYQNKASSFQKTFRLLFSFAVLFLFVILIPYVTIRTINEGAASRQKKLKDEILKKQEVLNTYEAIQGAIEGLHSDLTQGAQRLRQFILSRQQNEVQMQMIPHSNLAVQQPISTPPRQQDFLASLNELVQAEVQRQFEEYNIVLQSQVLAPLKSLENDRLIVIDLAKIAMGLDSLKQDFAIELAHNPDFWRTLSGKGGFYSTLDDKVRRFWQIHGAQIEEQGRVLQVQTNELQSIQNKLNDQLNKMKEQEQQIASRLEQIEFPFGKLPIGLTESIAVFPILLAIGFFVIASQLRETIQLRKNFHQLYQRKDPTRTVLDDQQIALIAPLWIDPLSPSKQRSLRLALLSIPVLVFIISCFLIFYSWTIPGFFGYAERLNWWLYGGLYGMSLLTLFYSYRHISEGLSSYSIN